LDTSDPIHQTVAARIRRGDVRGSSVTWRLDPKGGQSFERRSDGMIVRNILKVAECIDVGPTHIPCYAGTSAEMRSELTDADIELLRMRAKEFLIEPPTPIEFFMRAR
jgi:phage head maturation protease